MKTNTFRFLLLVFAIAFASACATTRNSKLTAAAEQQGLSAQSGADQRQVRATIAAFYAAFNAHDFERIKDHTTDDWVHIAPVGVVRRGRTEVLEALKRSFNFPQGRHRYA
jgi:hypothetical protein